MLKTLKDINVKGKKVLLRVDFNVPTKDGAVTDDTRIKEALKTITHLVDQGGLVSIVAHFGRPKGEKNLKYTLKPVADYINSKGYFKAQFVEDCIGDAVKAARDKQSAGTVLLLENVRFYKGEEANDPEFTKQLASGYDVYVNDAFGACHRKHASVYGVPAIVKEKAAGFLIEKEAKWFDKIVSSPEHPFVAIIGGAKISDKIGVIESLLSKADTILIGGAMAYTFLKFQGHTIGTSMVENDQMDTVKRVLQKASEKNTQILLPLDHLISAEFNGAADYAAGVDIPDGMMGLDIGSKTAMAYASALMSAKTVLWNGPMGVFENPAYANGTFSVAKALASLKDAITVVGGGDSVAAINQSGMADKVSHISTGGGASLEFLEYGTLPGIEILK
ncbi:MAG: phosphoglycerate kinase [Deferribacteraceae bacterium]|jgi:phosphoglycerate kinase|nr:phosphoglycerate kinase [Deferribacteraceae bacterium]